MGCYKQRGDEEGQKDDVVIIWGKNVLEQGNSNKG
jgi:hypothetical protein